MAKMSVMGLDQIDAKFRKMGRSTFQRIVSAGADAAAKRMRQNMENARHVRTKDLLDSVGPTEYFEYLGGGAKYVYPQGVNSRGYRRAMIAFVIDHGKGRKKTRKGEPSRMGDHFITGDTRGAEEAVRDAMQAEMEKITAEING
ncbi:MAG: hypothetical protein IKQ10_02700 [Oscillospiraceae bacterium]|nr:hypothetical protein [Oscillospiraceae bacterium]